eukprot:m51a1_g13953 hypothetical protein (418) ;mRNA; f:929076-930498
MVDPVVADFISTEKLLHCTLGLASSAQVIASLEPQWGEAEANRARMIRWHELACAVGILVGAHVGCTPGRALEAALADATLQRGPFCTDIAGEVLSYAISVSSALRAGQDPEDDDGAAEIARWLAKKLRPVVAAARTKPGHRDKGRQGLGHLVMTAPTRPATPLHDRETLSPAEIEKMRPGSPLPALPSPRGWKAITHSAASVLLGHRRGTNADVARRPVLVEEPMPVPDHTPARRSEDLPRPRPLSPKGWREIHARSHASASGCTMQRLSMGHERMRSNSTEVIEAVLEGSDAECDAQAPAEKPKCEGCGQALTGVYVVALGKAWHPQHLVCSQCPKTCACFVHEGKPYCKEHHNEALSRSAEKEGLPQCQSASDIAASCTTKALGGAAVNPTPECISGTAEATSLTHLVVPNACQ